MAGPEPIDVAAAVVLRDGKYLICQRLPGDRSGGLWEFPGGKREEGESLEECVVREIREELGCGITVGRLLEVVETDRSGRPLRLHFFAASLRDGEPRPIECAQVAWVSPAELASYDFLKPNAALVDRLVGGP